jgi:hypothetical protein
MAFRRLQNTVHAFRRIGYRRTTFSFFVDVVFALEFEGGCTLFSFLDFVFALGFTDERVEERDGSKSYGYEGLWREGV